MDKLKKIQLNNKQALENYSSEYHTVFIEK